MNAKKKLLSLLLCLLMVVSLLPAAALAADEAAPEAAPAEEAAAPVEVAAAEEEEAAPVEEEAAEPVEEAVPQEEAAVPQEEAAPAEELIEDEATEAPANLAMISIPVTAEFFPDELFRNYVSTNFDKDSNGTLSSTEVSAITDITFMNTNATSVKGIEYFFNLQTLGVRDNKLTSLDVSSNTKLTQLYCHNNQLTSLDVSKNTALTLLYCNSNQLTALDVNANTELVVLRCDSNRLTALNVYKNTKLTELNCYDNQLTELNVVSNTLLKDLDCSSNKLTALNVASNTKLTMLRCAHNGLSKLSVGTNTALTALEVQYNQLTHLDLSKNTALVRLDCRGNGLFVLNIKNNTELRILFCSDNALIGLDISATKVCAADITGCEVGRQECGELGLMLTNAQRTDFLADKAMKVENQGVLLLHAGSDLDPVEVTDETFPDEVFRELILEYRDEDKNGVLTGDELAYIQELFCSRMDISSLQGIEYFVNLTLLECIGNELTQLDVSQNTVLTSLNCSSNYLTELDLSNNPALKYIYCNDNCLSFVSVCGTKVLTDYYLAILGNQKDGGTITAAMTAGQKGFYDDDELAELNDNVRVNILVVPDLVYLNSDRFPDENLLEYLSMYELDGDEALSAAEIVKATAINCTDSDIYTLKGIEYLVCLRRLDCSNNRLTELDLSSNTMLTDLDCSHNNLTELDLSSNTMLEYLYCRQNHLAELDVSCCPKLKLLCCYLNYLTELDLSGNPLLSAITCDNNYLTEINIARTQIFTDATDGLEDPVSTLGNQRDGGTVRVIMTANQPSKYVSSGSGYSSDNVRITISIWGDTDTSGTVDLKDVSLLYRILTGSAAADDLSAAVVDITGDRLVTLRDVAALFQMYAENGYSVVMTSYGRDKLEVVKLVKSLADVSLSVANNMVNATADGPVVIMKGLTAAKADSVVSQLTAKGATVYKQIM